MKMKFIIGLLGLLFFTAAKAEIVPAGDFLLPNGTLNIAAIGSKQLTLNLAGWHVALDPERGPVFSTDPQMLADAWSALGMGLNAKVSALAVSGTDIYVGGSFKGTGAGGSAVPGLNCIAKWNGSAWSGLGSGLNDEVNTIVVSGTNLYVGGKFTGVGTGGTAVTGLNCIAKWNGSGWSALGSGLIYVQIPSFGNVMALAVSGTDIYVGGSFTGVGAGGTAVPGLNHIAKWNGVAWSALGSGLNQFVNALAVSGTDIYAGGQFTGVGSGGTPVSGLNYVTKWNGTSWSALGSGLNYGVGALAVSGTDLYVGGWFSGVGAGGTAVSGLYHVAKWNGTAWSALGGSISLNGVRALAVSGTEVYVGGDISGLAILGIAKWNGSTWSGLDGGLNTTVFSIAVSGTNIYAGGNFTNVSTTATPVPGLNYVAKFTSAENKSAISCKNVVVKLISISGKTVTLEVYAPKGAAISPSLYTIKNAKVKSAPIAGGAVANTKTWILEIIDTTVEASIKSNYCPEILKLN